MPIELLVIGAGGHAKVVIEAIQEKSQAYQVVLVDHDLTKEGKKVLGDISIKHLGNWLELPEQYHVAIGDNQIRQRLSIEAGENGKRPFTVMHLDASVSSSAYIGSGSFVAAKAVVAAEAKIGGGCIVNHGSIVEHDCQVGDYSHIASNAILGGNVKVGQGCLIGAGAIVLPMVQVGHHVVIGAGAVVTCDVPDFQIVVGVPGRCVSTNE